MGDSRGMPEMRDHNHLDFRKSWRSVELSTSKGEIPNQIRNLVDIIEATKSAIRTQVEENEELKSALQAAERELHAVRISQQKQDVSENTHPSSWNSSWTLDFKDGHAGTIPLFNLPTSSPPSSPYPRQNGSSSGNNNHTPNGSKLVGVHSNGSFAGESGRLLPHLNPGSNSPSLYPRRRDAEADQQTLYQAQDLPDFNNHSGTYLRCVAFRWFFCPSCVQRRHCLLLKIQIRALTYLIRGS